MPGQGRQAELGPFVGVLEVDIISTGARAIERAALRIAAGRAGLDRRAARGGSPRRRGARWRRPAAARRDRRDLGVEHGEQLGAAGVGVGEEGSAPRG